MANKINLFDLQNDHQIDCHYCAECAELRPEGGSMQQNWNVTIIEAFTFTNRFTYIHYTYNDKIHQQHPDTQCESTTLCIFMFMNVHERQKMWKRKQIDRQNVFVCAFDAHSYRGFMLDQFYRYILEYKSKKINQTISDKSNGLK